MFIYPTVIRLRNTDATGVLFFPEQLSIALEAFEEFLKEKGFPLKELLQSSYFLPVVHAEADYSAPLSVGDVIEVKLNVIHLGNSSLTLKSTFLDPVRNMEVGKVKIVHVLVDQKTRKSTPFPDSIRAILEASMPCPSELQG